VLPFPDLAPWQWAVAGVCAVSVGVAKTGVPGISMMVIPVLVLTVGDARQAAAWLLPLLCTGDVFAVAYWRRHALVGELVRLAPSVLAGMAAGAAALGLNERILRTIVALDLLIMMAVYLRRRVRPETFPVSRRAWTYGLTAGFATTVANAAGSAMNLYLLSMKLPKHEFIATGAWFFFVINLTKIPIYYWHGLFSEQSLAFDAAMAPLTVLGAVTGRWVFEHIPQKLFERLVIALTVAASLLLFR
jgi:hypothetical protein